MLNRKLGNTGVAVGKIALGTMYFGSETPVKRMNARATLAPAYRSRVFPTRSYADTASPWAARI